MGGEFWIGISDGNKSKEEKGLFQTRTLNSSHRNARMVDANDEDIDHRKMG